MPRNPEPWPQGQRIFVPVLANTGPFGLRYNAIKQPRSVFLTFQFYAGIGPDKLVEIEAVDPAESEGPQGGPPAPGSFAAKMVEFVDAVKVEWIDVLLRQLVLIVGFLGAMLATRRRSRCRVRCTSISAWWRVNIAASSSVLA